MRKLAQMTLAAFLALPMAGQAQTVEIGSAEFGAAIRQYLLDNPEVIFDAVEVHNQRQEVAAREAAQAALVDNATQIYNEDYAIVLGNPDGDVTVVEFSDYNCGYCKRSHGEIDKLIAADPNVRVLVQQLPIFGGQASFEAAQVLVAVELVAGKDKAYALHRVLFENNDRWDKASVLRMAGDLGIDVSAIETTLVDKNPTIIAAISQVLDLGQKLGFQGTPGFVIGEQILPGFAPAEVMGQMVDAARAGANS